GRDTRRPSDRRRARGRGSRRRARRARADVRAAADEPADRELRDRLPRRMSDGLPRPVVAVAVFPGSNDDRDALHALTLLDADAQAVWHGEDALPAGTAAVFL